jgi:hypothetical protein
MARSAPDEDSVGQVPVELLAAGAIKAICESESSTARPQEGPLVIGTARQIGSSHRLPTRSSFPLRVSSASGWMAHS